jgi:hypothetical protein
MVKMTEGLKKRSTFFLKSIFFKKIPPACLNEAHLPLQGRQKADFKSHALSVNNNKIPEDKK